ncbi:hypothetical protein OG381_34280 [Streptomyces sp. NBC_00490]|uniref:hypothetical protein n=1 Tax=Streptomyces sp. NBC_00490 TaxID=2903657 RepID=UPI002E16E128
MTDHADAVEPDNEAEGWDGTVDGVSYPETPDNPHNHPYTLSLTPKEAPFLVVRASTEGELKERLDSLETSGTMAAIGAAWSAYKGHATLGAGMGPTTPVPAAPAAPGVPAPPPMPGAPAMPPPPAAPAVSNRTAEYAQAGWYRLNVPFKDKATFDGITAQYGMTKGRPSEGGQFSFHKDTKAWYVHPQYAGAFPQFSPVPA